MMTSARNFCKRAKQKMVCWSSLLQFDRNLVEIMVMYETRCMRMFDMYTLSLPHIRRKSSTLLGAAISRVAKELLEMMMRRW